MNLILFEEADAEGLLAADDARAAHVREVLRMKPGDVFDVGVVNGPRGKARIASDDEEGMRLEITWGEEPEAALPIVLVVGLPRPQTARRILREATSLGVAAIRFFLSEKGEPSYRESRLWSTDEWQRHLLQGAEQAFTTRVPEVGHYDSLAECVNGLSGEGERLALDVYEAGESLSQVTLEGKEVCLAVGSERGWSAGERDVLRGAGFRLCHLGERVQRTETACIAGVSIIGGRLKII